MLFSKALGDFDFGMKTVLSLVHCIQKLGLAYLLTFVSPPPSPVPGTSYTVNPSLQNE